MSVGTTCGALVFLCVKWPPESHLYAMANGITLEQYITDLSIDLSSLRVRRY